MTPQIKSHFEAGGNLSRKVIVINNLLGGVAWGFGTVLGATLLVALLGYILKIFGVFAGIQEILNELKALQAMS